jgi:dimethylaniline monooxygenase (N-oxide forming)
LVTLKELRDGGHAATLFERQASIGGVFRDTYPNLRLTSSSALTSFGSFIGGDPSRPVHWSAADYTAYLEEFSRRFDLERHIRLETHVRSVSRTRGGGWSLCMEPAAPQGNGSSGRDMEFDHVVDCSGANSVPRLPTWADPSRFDGDILHSVDIRGPQQFAGKRVLIVGLGESGSDIAAMAAEVSTETAIATRSGPGYVIPRHYRGLPSDLDTNRCYHSLPRSMVGTPLVRFKVRIENALIGPEDDPRVLEKVSDINRAGGFSPFHRFSTKSTGFVRAILDRGASYRPGVAELHRNRVVFVDGSEFLCDTIVCCTGFGPATPFLALHEPELARRAQDPRSMYKRMIVPELGTAIAWIGYVRPGVGSIPPCAEMQARYLAQLLGDEARLPSMVEMRADIRLHAELDRQQFPADSERLPTLTDFFRFMETMADAIGCRPSIARILPRDPRLALQVLFGPLSAAQYRLRGPGADPERARAALVAMPTMPWPVLAYEALLLFISMAIGRSRSPGGGLRPLGPPTGPVQ